MPKTCKSCTNFVFGGGYCINHQYLREDGKAPKPLKDTGFKPKAYEWKSNSTFKVKPPSETPKKVVSKKEKNEDYMEKADQVFSQYIRQLHSDSNGMVKCFTCSKTFHWKEVDNGHYITRSNRPTRYSEDNCRPQCQLCNRIFYGKEDLFRINLVKEIGEGRVTEMEESQNRVHKMSRMDYFEIYQKYRDLLPSVKKP